MKKTLISTVIKCFTICSIFSANFLVSAQDSRLGIKGGVNFSNLVGGDEEDINDENILTSFHVGIFTQVGVSDVFFIQPELLYSRKGAEASLSTFGPGSGNRQDVKFKLDYIELPVMFKFQILETISLEAGPYAAYLISSKLTDGDNNEFAQFDTDNFRKLDLGLAVGAGFNLAVVEIGARYNYGLTSLDKNDNGLDVRNSTLSAYLAFKL